MRLSRRSFLLASSAAAATGIGGYALAQRPEALSEAHSVPVQARPIRSLSVTDQDRRTFGSLTFRSGLVLKSAFNGFGGFSGLWRSADGQRLVAMTDNAQWLTAKVEWDDAGGLDGLTETVMAPLLGPDGVPLRRTRYYDTEGFTISGGVAYVTTERKPALFRFDWTKAGAQARGQPLPLPPETRDLPRNNGLEAVGLAPKRSPLGGAIVAIAEQSQRGAGSPTQGFIVTGPRRGLFEVVRSDDYDITDLTFLPDGDLLLLERRFSLLGGFGARIRRFPADGIRPGALADGPVLFESDPSMDIDNMEGMSLHRDGRDLVLSLVSDDNFQVFQRTLLLEFTLAA